METDAAHEEKLSGAGKRTATSTDRSEGDDDGTEQQESRRKRVKVELGASGGEALKQEGPLQQRHDRKRKKKKEKKSKSKGSKKAIKLRLSQDMMDAGKLSFAPEGRNFSSLPLKKDHPQRPLWVTSDRHVFLEAFSPLYSHATDFLIAVAEPVCRPDFIHEYELTPYSLYAAVSIGLTTDDIINFLETLSKVQVPEVVNSYIREKTSKVGRIKLVLMKTRTFIESQEPDLLRELILDPRISEMVVRMEEAVQGTTWLLDEEMHMLVRRQGAAASLAAPRPGSSSTSASSSGNATSVAESVVGKEGSLVRDLAKATAGLSGSSSTFMDEDRKGKVFYAFEVFSSQVEHVKERANELDYPLVEEYDFRHDDDPRNPNLAIDLKSSTTIRPYQEKSLAQMFGNRRARSGMIVLPCGAGKTLVGVTAAQTIKKRCLVLCTSNVSCQQWRGEFLKWTTLSPEDVAVFTSDTREMLPQLRADRACVLVTTFTMIGKTGKRSELAERIIQTIKSLPWGLVLLDEVHVLPANMFRRVINIPSHCKLGLTATLVREDEKINDLTFLIGPKLYEANWKALQEDGYLASVKCLEVWCPMTREFYEEYLTQPARRRPSLYVMNPNKFRVCQFLVEYHKRRGDKIIIFSDMLYPLRRYAELLHAPFICGDTVYEERMKVIEAFKRTTASTSENSSLSSRFVSNVLLISKVGDTSIDLPEANVIIQISSHFGSRRQEAQRLGRILRPKGNVEHGKFNAFFYSLVSRDTSEMYFSSKRQKFLVNQGYAFNILTSLGEECAIGSKTGNLSKHKVPVEFAYESKEEQIELLSQVVSAIQSGEADQDEALPEDVSSLDIEQFMRDPEMRPARRSKGNMAQHSGAGDSMYMEIQGPESSRGRGARGGRAPKRGVGGGRGRGSSM